MDPIRRKNVSKAFEASFLVPGAMNKQASYRDYSVKSENEIELFSKYAGYVIPKPTQDNVDSFLRDTIHQEITGIGVSLSEISVKFENIEEKQDNNGFISEANGTVMVPVYKKMLEIPFIVDNGELLNFDIIKMENQKVPYSRENLRSVILGLRKIQEEEDSNGPNGDVFKSVAEAVSPMTSPGFLSSALSIRDSVARNRNTGIFSSASELDGLLEKVASLKPATKEDLEKLANICNEKQASRISQLEEKYASEDENENVSRTDDKLYVANRTKHYDDAKKLPNYSLIYFYEKNGNNVEKVKGLVLKDFKKMNNFKNFYGGKQGDKTTENKIVLTEQRKVYFLNDIPEFLCEKVKTDDNHFAIHSVPMASIKSDAIFLKLNPKEQKSTPILALTRKSYIANSKDVSKDQIGYKDSAKFPYSYFSNKEPGVSDFNTELQLRIIKDEKVMKMHLNQNDSGCIPTSFSEVKLILKNDTKQNDNDFVLSDSGYYTCDRATLVTPLSGIGESYISPRTSIESEACFDDVGLTKTASSSKGFVKLTCRDRNRHLYDVHVRFDDKSKHLFKDVSKKFSYIPEHQARSLLKQMKIDGNDAHSMILKSRNEPSATYQLKNPLASSDFGKTQGITTNITKDKIKGTLSKFVSPEKLFDAALTAITAAGVSSIVRNQVHNNQQKRIKADKALLNKMASNSECLSKEFEKKAMSEKDNDFLTLAKTATICYHFEDMCDKIINGEIYLDSINTANEIQKCASELSNVYYGLCDLKEMQHHAKKELVSFEKIAAMQNHIFTCSRIAEEILKNKPFK